MNSLKVFSKTEWTVLLSVAFVFWFVDGALFVLLSGLWFSSASIKYLFWALIRPGVVIIITAMAAVLVDSLFSTLHMDKTISLVRVMRAIILISIAFLSFVPAQIAYLTTYHAVTQRTEYLFGSGVTGIFGIMPLYQIFALLLFSICLLIVLSSYRRKKIFLLLTSLLIVGITIIAYEKLVIRDLMDEQWFKVLRMTQPNKRYNRVSPVIVFPMTKWVGKERFGQLMTIIANSNPKVIGVLKPLYWQPFGLEPDMGGDTSLLTIVDPKKAVYGASHTIYDIWNPSFWETRIQASQSRFVPYEFPIFVNVRDRLDRGALTGLKYIPPFGFTCESGMYYKPILENKMQQRWTEEEVDIALPIVAKYLDQSIPKEIVQRKSWFSNSFVEIFGRRIPLTSDGTAIVNYHENSSFLVPQLDSIHSESARVIHVGCLSKDRTKLDFISVYDEYSDILYQLKDGVLQPYAWDLDKPLSKPAVNRIQALEGKIIIVTVEQAGRAFVPDPVGFTYTAIIDNILDNDFITPLNDIWIGAISVIFMVFIGLMFDRWTAGKALVGTLGFTTMVLLIFIVLFGLAHIFISPFSIALPLLLSAVIFFLAEFIRERDKLQTERATLKAELQTAHDMQMGLMPMSDPAIEGYEISGKCFPANEVGGDFFDYVWLDDEKNKLGIAVADVSGKAMKAAVTAVMTSGMISREVGTNEKPKSILKKINRPMYLKTDRQVFTALSFAVIDIKKKELTFSNAGQMIPLLRRGESLQSIKVEGLRLPLGVKEEVEYNEVSIQLQFGDVLIFFTDGIVEAKNSMEELWGLERMEETFRTMSLEKSAKEIVEAFIAEANSFAGTAKQYDDMTIVVVKVL